MPCHSHCTALPKPLPSAIAAAAPCHSHCPASPSPIATAPPFRIALRCSALCCSHCTTLLVPAMHLSPAVLTVLLCLSCTLPATLPCPHCLLTCSAYFAFCAVLARVKYEGMLSHVDIHKQSVLRCAACNLCAPQSCLKQVFAIPVPA